MIKKTKLLFSLFILCIGFSLFHSSITHAENELPGIGVTEANISQDK